MSYLAFKQSVLGKKIGDGECVSLVVNNPQAYCEYLFPGIRWTEIMAPVEGAKDLAGKSNKYLTWVPNDHANVNQLPEQGDIMVFGATPAAGYTNTYDNPYGHTGICDHATATYYSLLQQNAPAFGQSVNVTTYGWRVRPCLGWYRPKVSTPKPTPAPKPATSHTIYLPPTTGPWHLYNDNGPYIPAKAKGILMPSEYGGLSYKIVADKGNGVYVINSQMFGQGALWTKGSKVVIR